MARDTLFEIEETRPLKPAMMRGWTQCCPSCGQGPIFDGYLTVRHQCPVCEEDLSHQRADDGPAYLTMVVVGKLLAPLILAAYTMWEPDALVMASIFSVLAVGMCLYLLPRIKGAMIGIQWAKRMHGFGGPPD